MQRQYFAATTVEDIKVEYRKLVKEYHPDLHRGEEDVYTEHMKRINNEFEWLVTGAYRAESGEKYSRETEESILNLQAILDQIIALPGVEIEICGTWIWVSGDTYPVKDRLKAAGFLFSGQKKMWYHTGGGERKKRRGTMDMDDIRDKHGSRKVAGKTRMALA
jgi:curved DNA-binding protein CbpA